MDYILTRNEARTKDEVDERFVCLEMDDGVEKYNFGYWLTPAEVAAVAADAGAIDGIAATASVKGEAAFEAFKIYRELPPPEDPPE